MSAIGTNNFIRVSIVLVSLILAAAVETSAQASQAAGPSAVIESTRHDFGEVFVGEELSHVFTVRNMGGSPLVLSQTKLVAIRRPTSVRPRTLRVRFEGESAAPG